MHAGGLMCEGDIFAGHYGNSNLWWESNFYFRSGLKYYSYLREKTYSHVVKCIDSYLNRKKMSA